MKIIKIYIYFLAFIGFCKHIGAIEIPASSDPRDVVVNELCKLESLIAVTEENLSIQKNLLNQLKIYQKIQAQYLGDMDNRELLLKMIKVGHQILTLTKENHLQQVFDQEFLEELTLLSQIASKKEIPKP